MQNKYFKLLIITLVVAIIVPQAALAAWWNPFSWGIWNRIFHFQRTEQKQEQQQKVGGDKDEHGCIGSAGYSWCGAKQKCLRPWEEACSAEIKVIKVAAPIKISDINLQGNYIDAKVRSTDKARDNKAIRIKTTENTIYKSTCGGTGNGAGDGLDNFLILNKNWDSPEWWFTVTGPMSDDESVIFANQITCEAQ